MPVASFQVQHVEPAIGCNLPVACVGAKFAVHAMKSFMAIAAVQFHFTTEIREVDIPISGSKVHTALLRHVDVDVHAMIADIHNVKPVGETQIDLDGVAALVFFELQSAGANLVMRTDDGRLDCLLVPGIDMNVRIGRFYSQIRGAGDVISLRPLFSACGNRAGDCQR